MSKLWDGRFTLDSDKLADEFNTSLPIDCKLYVQDITASIAHARMLGKTQIISCEDANNIIDALKSILLDINNNDLIIKDAEDIHMFVEEELTKRIGTAGKRLHTARSRNDQVVTDFKLYILDSITRTKSLIIDLMDTIINLAGIHKSDIMPGFTHLQKAQPITLGHHLMAYAEMLYRDLTRFDDSIKRVSLCPLGAGALAGTTFPIDRLMVAEELGFKGVTNNSMDSVSDRDYVTDYLYNATMTLIHLSRFAEEIIMWASNEYQFIELSDAFSTGSSIMPQKKNPDMAELVRGKSGKLLGNLVSIITIIKGQPLAYNKDMQEDKSLFFDTETNLLKSIVIFDKMLATSRFNTKKMRDSAKRGFTNATDVADYLVNKGMPFRQAHSVSGKLVAYCITKNKMLEELPLATFKEQSELFSEDIYQAIDLKTLINNRNSIGGTSPKSISRSISNLKNRLKKLAK